MKPHFHHKFKFYPFFFPEAASDGKELGSLPEVSTGNEKGFNLGTETESCRPWLDAWLKACSRIRGLGSKFR